MKSWMKIVPTLVTAVALVACSSPPPEPTTYLLRGAPSGGTAKLEGTMRAGLGRVVVAPYLLASQGVVVETAPGEIRAATYHQWAEPLDAGLRWYLRSEIARELGFQIGSGWLERDWDYTIEVYVGRLHGTINGSALLEAVYVIRRSDDTGFTEYRFSKTVDLSEDGYAALVEAEQGLLDALASSIANALREQPVPGTQEASDEG